MTAQVIVQERNARLGRHAVIIGGGISGLSAAFFLSRQTSPGCSPPRITVLEASDRFGGVLRTLTRGDLRTEAGADAFYAGLQRPAVKATRACRSHWDSGRSDAADLCRELGLGVDLIAAAPCFRRFFMLRGPRCVSGAGPQDSSLSAARLLFDPRLSFPEKCRILGEPFIPRRKEDGDESAADFFRRRLGEGFFREIAAPLVRGVYMADPERLSMESVFPRFREAERNCGSLAGAFLWGSGRSKKSGGEFLTLKNGLEGLVRALVRELGGCELRCSTPVRRCVYDQGWEVFPENGEVLRADALCLAMNACDSAKLLSRAAPELSRELAGIRYDSIATVNLIYKADDMTTQRLAPGFLVPMAGDRYPFSSLKWLGMSPDGKQFSARAFISGTMLPEVFHEDDDALAQKIRAFLQESFGIRAIPALMSVERYPHALPQYETGHLERVARIEKECLRYPGLYLAGNGFQGFGITDCIARAGVPMPPARSRGLDGQSSQARTVSRPNSKPSFEIPKPG